MKRYNNLMSRWLLCKIKILYFWLRSGKSCVMWIHIDKLRFLFLVFYQATILIIFLMGLKVIQKYTK